MFKFLQEKVQKSSKNVQKSSKKVLKKVLKMYKKIYRKKTFLTITNKQTHRNDQRRSNK